MPARFQHDVAYFMTPAGSNDVPALGKNEFWIRAVDAAQWLDEGVVEVVSPLDSQRKAEIELTEEQEAWLEWMVAHQIQHVRLDAGQ